MWKDDYEKESGERFRARDYADKPDYVEEISRDVIYPWIMEHHADHLNRMKVSSSPDTALPHIVAWFQQQINTAPEGVNIWTDAPPDYDHRYTFRTKDKYVWGVSGKTLTRVIIPAGSVEWQVRRYESGLHIAFDDARMEKERIHDEKFKARMAYSDEIARLWAELRRAASYVPATMDRSTTGLGGTWRIGSQHGYPPADPEEAIRIIRSARSDFAKLPIAVRGEEWRIESELTELVRLAGRAREVADREASEKRAKQEELRRNLEAAYEASKPGMVLVKMSDGTRNAWPTQVYGRVLTVPTEDYLPIETETGRMSVKEYLEKWVVANALTPSGVPPTVWKAGALPDVQVITHDGKRYYAWRPLGGWKPNVVGESGRRISESSSTYTAVSGKYIRR
jgi:hypothetical protein